MAVKDYQTFGEVRERLDKIVVEVRDRDLSLEKSLDLYEEAIQLGNRCAELIDTPDYTAEEALAAQEAHESEQADEPADKQTDEPADKPEQENQDSK